MSESSQYNAPYLDRPEHAQIDHTGIPGVGEGGGGGDPFPPNPDLGGLKTYIIENDETLAITTADFSANMTVSSTSSMGMISVTQTLLFNGGTASLALDPSDNGALLSGDLVNISAGLNAIEMTADGITVVGPIGFYDTPPVARPTGVAVTAEAIHAALVSLGLITA